MDSKYFIKCFIKLKYRNIPKVLVLKNTSSKHENISTLMHAVCKVLAYYFYKPRATELAEMSNPVLISLKKKMFYQGNAHC